MAATVIVDALAVVRISKHAQNSSGFLVGIDNHVTGAYPFPASSDGTTDAKNHATYQDAMLKHLKEVNVDAQCVGWYTVTSMGNFINQHFIDNQLHYQKSADDNRIALVFDTARSASGSLALKAYRLSAAFLNAHKEGKFTAESIQKSGLRYQDILIEHPVSIHNSHIVTSYLHDLAKPSQTVQDRDQLTSSTLTKILSSSTPPSVASPDLLDLSIDPYLEKSCDLLLDSIESHQVEQNNLQYHQRALGREQAKITAWQQKRKAENAIRATNKQPPLDENEWQRLFKLPQEPSRLDSLLIGRQIEQYGRQVDGFTATASTKMFAAREVL